MHQVLNAMIWALTPLPLSLTLVTVPSKHMPNEHALMSPAAGFFFLLKDTPTVLCLRCPGSCDYCCALPGLAMCFRMCG